MFNFMILWSTRHQTMIIWKTMSMWMDLISFSHTHWKYECIQIGLWILPYIAMWNQFTRWTFMFHTCTPGRSWQDDTVLFLPSIWNSPGMFKNGQLDRHTRPNFVQNARFALLEKSLEFLNKNLYKPQSLYELLLHLQVPRCIWIITFRWDLLFSIKLESWIYGSCMDFN